MTQALKKLYKPIRITPSVPAPTRTNTNSWNRNAGTQIVSTSVPIAIQRTSDEYSRLIDQQINEQNDLQAIREEVSQGKTSQFLSNQAEYLEWCQRNNFAETVTSTKIMQFVRNEVLCLPK
jgi:hypothetical protein